MKTPSSFQHSELRAALWAFRREFAVCLVFSVLINILMLTPTMYMLQLFDRVMLSQNLVTLTVLTIVMLLCFAAVAFAEWSRSRVLVRLGVKLDQQLNSRVFAASFEAALRQQGKTPTQGFGDLANVRQFLTGNGLFALMDAPWTPIYLIVLFLLHPWLGILGIVFSLILGGMAWVSHRMSHASIEAAQEAGGQVGGYIHSKLRNAEVIEAMGMLANLRARWKARQQHYLELNRQASDVSERVKALTKFVRYTQQSLALAAGAVLVIRGELSPGAMIAANVLLGRVTQPVDMIVMTWKSFLSARKAFLRLEETLAQNPPRDTTLVHAEPKGQLSLKNVIATAPSRPQAILKDLTIDFPAGEVIGVVGPSGSGKSTLARTLVGIWPYTDGRVQLDGVPLERWERDELGPYLGYLPQDIELFEGSIAENIARFGEVEPDKVIRACQRAGVHDMILRFPQGYDTEMGQAGGLLSGGQRQRIALARAMYGDPKLLVLDEPNSNLDDVGETALLKAVQDLKQQGSTVFVITHRPSVLSVADRLLVLNDGRIALYGPRADVIATLQAQAAAQPGPSPAAQPA
ncbi:type I secretion system permease/ATPase [Zoogloea sp. LCSB751]|uniref:type I secretion system permease/ATPase n=1 Tax=Zoogloea sp. LCSB751 TaxID=1965277 RepID=UPI0009A4A6AC|nr:type I secretion system permease/ATPase [Zoogloea sp. LCSB751]